MQLRRSLRLRKRLFRIGEGHPLGFVREALLGVLEGPEELEAALAAPGEGLAVGALEGGGCCEVLALSGDELPEQRAPGRAAKEVQGVAGSGRPNPVEERSGGGQGPGEGQVPGLCREVAVS